MSPADVIRARDFGYRQQYDSALAITSAAIAGDPSDAAGYYWQAGIIQLLIYDSGRGGLADSFFECGSQEYLEARYGVDLPRFLRALLEE